MNSNEVEMNMNIVKFSGPLNVNRAEEAVRLFRELFENGSTRLVVNLEDVPFVDSRGLSALLAGYVLFGSDPDNFRLVGLQVQPRLLFQVTGFNRIFHTPNSTSKAPARSTQPLPATA